MGPPETEWGNISNRQNFQVSHEIPDIYVFLSFWNGSHLLYPGVTTLARQTHLTGKISLEFVLICLEKTNSFLVRVIKL